MIEKLDKLLCIGAAATGVTAILFVIRALIGAWQKQVEKEEKEESCRKS